MRRDAVNFEIIPDDLVCIVLAGCLRAGAGVHSHIHAALAIVQPAGDFCFEFQQTHPHAHHLQCFSHVHAAQRFGLQVRHVQAQLVKFSFECRCWLTLRRAVPQMLRAVPAECLAAHTEFLRHANYKLPGDQRGIDLPRVLVPANAAHRHF